MAFEQYALEPNSFPFQTLDWLPFALLHGESFPEAVGPGTAYPSEMIDSQIARIYWEPQQFVIVNATIETEEYGVRSLDVPIIPGLHRSSGDFIARQCYHLLQGIGGSVDGGKEFPDAPNGGVTVEAEFTMNPAGAMQLAFTNESFWLEWGAQIDIVPNVTGAVGVAATVPQQSDWIETGVVRVMTQQGRNNYGMTAPLYSPPPVPFYVAKIINATIEIGHVPWPFTD